MDARAVGASEGLLVPWSRPVSCMRPIAAEVDQPKGERHNSPSMRSKGLKARQPVAPAPPAERSAVSHQPALVYLSILLVTLNLAVFAPTRNFSFVSWDDTSYVSDNAAVKQGLTIENVGWALTNAGHFYWHPLTWLSHMADVEMFGLDAGKHHLTSLALHTGATILLFFVLRRMTGCLYRSALVAAVFAVHPLRVESVAWVAERKDVLSGVFFMLTLWAYAGYAQRRTLVRYLLVVVLFALGLMSKPTLVMAPLVLLLLDIWPLGRTNLGAYRLIVEKVPLLALSIAASIVTLLTQLHGEAVSTLQAVPVGDRLANAAAATVGYIGMAIWPIRLAAFYPFRPVPTWWVVSCVLILATASVAVVRLRSSRPYLTVGWFWYLVMLVPVIGLVQAGSQSMADRFTYLPLVGLLIACVWSVADLLGPLPSRRWVAGVCAAAVVGTCAVAARIQVGYWKDSETLWRRAVQVVPNNDLAYANLGRVLADTGRQDEALADFTEAIRIVDTHDPETGTGRGAPPPEYAAVLHGSRGLLLARMGRFLEAVPDLREAARLRPASADRHYVLAMALASAGRIQEAIEQGRQAIQLEPSRAHFHADLAFVLYRSGDLPAGITELHEALRLSPSHGDAARWHYNLASMLNATGRTDESVRELRLALALNPAYEQARRALNEMLKEGR